MDPHALFDEWLAEALLGEPNDPTAMALATADREGFRRSGWCCSRAMTKGASSFIPSRQPQGLELAGRPRAALLFHGNPCAARSGGRAVAEAVDDEEADAYFATRSRDSSSAPASDQSRPLELRAVFEDRYGR